MGVGAGGGWEVSFVIHLFHEVVVADPTSSKEPLCTLYRPKRAPLHPSSPLCLPLETDSMDCMHDIPAVWVAQPFTASPQQYTGLLKHNSRGTSTHDPSSDYLPHLGARPCFPLSVVFNRENFMRYVDVLLAKGSEVQSTTFLSFFAFNPGDPRPSLTALQTFIVVLAG